MQFTRFIQISETSSTTSLQKTCHSCSSLWQRRWFLFFYSFSLFYLLLFGCATQLVGSQFPDQGLDPGHDSESTDIQYCLVFTFNLSNIIISPYPQVSFNNLSKKLPVNDNIKCLLIVLTLLSYNFLLIFLRYKLLRSDKILNPWLSGGKFKKPFFFPF